MSADHEHSFHAIHLAEKKPRGHESTFVERLRSCVSWNETREQDEPPKNGKSIRTERHLGFPSGREG
jgi:hypothetical protein